MPFAPFLLRVLLSLCLALNGLPALAMHVPVQAMAQADTSHEAAGAMPCHGDEAAAEPMTHHAAATFAETDRASDDSTPPSPDCCETGACRCACVHFAQAVMPVLQVPAIAIARDHGVRALAPGHAAPALPHPIRPPIG